MKSREKFFDHPAIMELDQNIKETTLKSIRSFFSELTSKIETEIETDDTGRIYKRQFITLPEDWEYLPREGLFELIFDLKEVKEFDVKREELLKQGLINTSLVHLDKGSESGTPMIVVKIYHTPKRVA